MAQMEEDLMQCNQCATAYDPRQQGIQYCVQCGWKLCSLGYIQSPTPLPLHGKEIAECTLTLSNDGAGDLEFKIGNLPTGVTPKPHTHLPTNLVRLEANKSSTLKLCIDPTKILDKEAINLDIPITSNDRRGTKKDDYRPLLRDLERPHSLSILLDRRALGPVVVEQSLLVFREEPIPQYLHIHNLGQAHTTVTLVAEGGFLITSVPNEPPREKITLSLSEAKLCKVRVQAPPSTRDQREQVGIITITGAGLEKGIEEVILQTFYAEPTETQHKKWHIGIDFGTSKTAVFVQESFRPESSPRPILWEDETGTLQYSVPSLLLRSGSSTDFGYHITRLPGDKIFRSFKSLLHQDKASQEEQAERIQIVSDFLHHIRRNIELADFLQNENVWENSQCVMSLPILDNDVAHKNQETLTRLAAEEAGFEVENIEWAYEPDVAAVDFLNRHDEMGMHPKEGEYICVFDSGAGTTDISILKVRMEGEVPHFVSTVRAGFPVAGDLLDMLLVEDFKPQIRADIPTQNLLEETRRAKHRLLIPKHQRSLRQNHEEKLDTLVYDVNLLVGWNQIRNLYLPYINAMLQTGIGRDKKQVIYEENNQPTLVPIEKEYPSLLSKMAQEGISKKDIRWLCLVGGSSIIPCVIESLTTLFRNAALIPPLEHLARQQEATTPDYTLNVARGASRWLLRRVSGQLPFPIRAGYETKFSHRAVETLLAQNDLPGKPIIERQCKLAPADTVCLKVFTETNRGEGCLYTWRRTNTTAQVIDIRYWLTYTSDRKILLKITQDGSPEEYTVLA